MGPGDGAWSDLPPMAHGRSEAAACVLPSGRVAVVGGISRAGRNAGEAFDPKTGAWSTLPLMARGRSHHAAVAVAGGLVVVGGGGSDAPNELFDEASGRWFELPHLMAEPRFVTCVVSLPAAALVPAPVAGAAAAAEDYLDDEIIG